MNIIFFPNALAHLSNSLNTQHTSDSTSSSSSSSLSSSNSLSPLASSPINSVRTLSSVSSPALSAWSLSGLSNMGNSIATPAATALIPAASGSFSAQLWRQTSNATTLSESPSLKSSSSSSSSFAEVRSAGSSASSSSSASISKRIEIYDNGQLLYEFVSPKVVRNILSTIDGGVSLRQRGGKLLLLGDDVIAAAGQYEIQRKASYVHANYPHIHTPFQTMDEWQLRQSQQNKFNFRFR